MTRPTKPFDPKLAVSIREEELTLQEIGARLGGLSKERVRQIERSAMRKFRAACDALGVDPQDLVEAWRANP